MIWSLRRTTWLIFFLKCVLSSCVIGPIQVSSPHLAWPPPFFLGHTHRDIHHILPFAVASLPNHQSRVASTIVYDTAVAEPTLHQWNPKMCPVTPPDPGSTRLNAYIFCGRQVPSTDLCEANSGEIIARFDLSKDGTLRNAGQTKRGAHPPRCCLLRVCILLSSRTGTDIPATAVAASKALVACERFRAFGGPCTHISVPLADQTATYVEP
jgi:hypothetical protein